MSAISGVWVLNEVLTASGWVDISVGETVREAVQVTVGTANPYSCTCIYVNRTDEQHLLYAFGGTTLQIYYWVYNSGESTDYWKNGNDSAHLDFGTEPQEVSDEFYAWLSANATPIPVLTYDHTALLQGYWVGKRLAAMRGKRKPVAYLYNGVRLPDINSVWTDKETYPYAYIGYYVSDTHTITLVLSKTTMTAFSGDDGTTIGDDALGHKLYSYYTDKAWSPWVLGWFLCNPFWASHELACEDGTICLEASEPVPVYE